MAIRGNYGIFFDRSVGATTNLADGNTPGFADTSGNTNPNANGADFRASTVRFAPACSCGRSDHHSRRTPV